MQPYIYIIFKYLAIILLTTKFFGIIAKKFNIPQSIGAILAGVVIGPHCLGLVNPDSILITLAEIGIILLVFSTGLGINAENFKKAKASTMIISFASVLIPLIAGSIVYMLFIGFSSAGTAKYYKAIIMGIIAAGSSLSIAVKSFITSGRITSEVSAAISNVSAVNNFICIVLLAVIIGISGKNPADSEIVSVILRIILFLVFSAISGLAINKIFKRLNRKYENSRRIPILGLALCFYLSYAAERYFGVTDILGAFIAGIILCSIKNSDYIDSKLNISSYMIFSPVFFACIGLECNPKQLNLTIIAFAVAFMLICFAAKYAGGFIGSKITGKTKTDCNLIGVGLLTAGELSLAFIQKCSVSGIIESLYTPVVLLIVFASVLQAFILKKTLNK